jgi:site-specific recombinase XerD
MPVRIRAGSKVNKTVKTDSSFPLRIIHIRKMFEVADLKAKVILSTATDLGLRISDFIKIKKSDLPSLRAETPIAFEVMTKKEETIAYGFLSDETVQLLKLYLPTLKSENLYLFPSNGKSHVSDEWLNRLLKKLADKAQIDLNGKSLTFHVFRKMFLSTSIDSGIGLTAGKKLCGKAISQSDDTYLTTVKLREKFIQLKRFLTIQKPTEPANHKQLEAFEDVVSKLQKEVTQQKLITDTITKENLRMEKELKYLGSQEYMNQLVDKILKMIADFDSYSKRYGRDKPSF